MKKIRQLLIFSLFFCVFAYLQGSEFDFMHSASFKFSNGVPFIRAHVKSYPEGIKANNLSFFECNEKKIKTESVTIFVNKFTPQEVMYKLSFQELSLAELKTHQDILSSWLEKTGVPVEIFVHGAIFSINTLKIDNREYYVAAKELLKKEKAYLMLAKYRADFPDRSISLIPVMTKPSGSELSVTDTAGTKYLCMNTVTVHHKDHFFADKDKYEGESVFFFTASSLKNLELAVEDSVENLVQKILPGEMFLSAPLETLKAQAVAARTDIFMQLGKRHVSEPWHICSEVHCQKILWGKAIDPKFITAVKETEGTVIMHNGSHIARAPYCSSSGGRTEDIRHVWFSAEKAYLKGVWDGEVPLDLDLSKESDLKKFLDSDYGEDNIPMNRKHRWTVAYKQEELDEIANKSLNIGTIHSIEALARGVSGRIYKAVFKGSKGTETVYGELNIRKILNNMNSSAFIVSKTDGLWTFSGAGWGHGVGMSQMGAISLGKKDKDYKYILKRYYPGIETTKIY